MAWRRNLAHESCRIGGDNESSSVQAQQGGNVIQTFAVPRATVGRRAVRRRLRESGKNPYPSLSWGSISLAIWSIEMSPTKRLPLMKKVGVELTWSLFTALSRTAVMLSRTA